MELDTLKNALKLKLEAGSHSKNEEALQQALQMQAVSVIAKMKQSLWFEIIFSLLMLLLFVSVALFNEHTTFQIYFSIFIPLTLAMMLVLVQLLKKIDRLSNTALPVKQNLQKIIAIIGEYTKRSYQCSMLLIPVCMIIAFSVGILNYDIPANRGWQISGFTIPAMVGVLFLLIACCSVFSIAMYYFTRWYLKKLYGKHLTELKNHLLELETA